MSDTDQILEENGLVYLTDSEPGIARELKRNVFIFTDPQGKRVNDSNTLERIHKLVIPPAWTQVWIAPKKNAHLQATGVDQAGRKQYRYHDDWRKSRNETKYFRLLEFGSKLPEFRRNISKDLRRKALDERKVLAISVDMMQKTLIRVGSESYRQLYGSYGLTTLKDKHVKVAGNKLMLTFQGKKRGMAGDQADRQEPGPSGEKMPRYPGTGTFPVLPARRRAKGHQFGTDQPLHPGNDLLRFYSQGFPHLVGDT